GAPGLRVMYAKGEYHQAILPNIRGQAVVTIDWKVTSGPDGRNLIAPTVGAFVKLDSRVLSAASALAGSIAAAKAEKEASRLVRVFEKTTRAINDNPGAVLEALRQRAGTPRRELEEFGRLLSVPAASAAPAPRRAAPAVSESGLRRIASRYARSASSSRPCSAHISPRSQCART